MEMMEGKILPGIAALDRYRKTEMFDFDSDTDTEFDYKKFRMEVYKMRTPVIAGNWKMHNTVDESLKLVRELKSLCWAWGVLKLWWHPFLPRLTRFRRHQRLEHLACFPECVLGGEGRLYRRNNAGHAERCWLHLCYYRPFRASPVFR